MLFLYEGYINIDDNGDVRETVQEHECKQSEYSDINNFINLGTLAGQSDAYIVNGMLIHWIMIYVGY